MYNVCESFRRRIEEGEEVLGILSTSSTVFMLKECDKSISLVKDFIECTYFAYRKQVACPLADSHFSAQ